MINFKFQAEITSDVELELKKVQCAKKTKWILFDLLFSRPTRTREV